METMINNTVALAKRGQSISYKEMTNENRAKNEALRLSYGATEVQALGTTGIFAAARKR